MLCHESHNLKWTEMTKGSLLIAELRLNTIDCVLWKKNTWNQRQSSAPLYEPLVLMTGTMVHAFIRAQ